ncbi:hypothetical protein GCM10027276_34580 [Comamonas piscis]
MSTSHASEIEVLETAVFDQKMIVSKGCIEDGGEMECKLAKIKNTSYLLCDESAANAGSMYFAEKCGWNNMHSDNDLQDKAECFSDGITSCSGSVADPVVWSNVGDVYLSSVCWDITDGVRSGNKRKFAKITGTSIHRNSTINGFCSVQGLFPKKLVALKSVTHECDIGWALFDIPLIGEVGCRRPYPLDIDIKGPSHTQALPSDVGPITQTVAVKMLGNPKADVGVSITLKDSKLSIVQNFSGTTNASGEFSFVYAPPFLRATVVNMQAKCSTCGTPAEKSILVSGSTDVADPLMCRRQ